MTSIVKQRVPIGSKKSIYIHFFINKNKENTRSDIIDLKTLETVVLLLQNKTRIFSTCLLSKFQFPYGKNAVFVLNILLKIELFSLRPSRLLGFEVKTPKVNILNWKNRQMTGN